MEIAAYKKYFAEWFGTMVLTLFGCGSAAIAGGTLGNLGIAVAFGLSIIAMAFVIGDVSGCHINPAVSFGCWLDGRMSGGEMIGYWIAQFIGGICGAILLMAVEWCTGFPVGEFGLGANGFDEASSIGLTGLGAFLVETILTCVFVLSVLGSTANEKTAPFAGIIIGCTLAFVHVMGIPLTGTSVNPARSFGPALMMLGVGDWLPIAQVWVFLLAPLVGAALGVLVWRIVQVDEP